MRRFYAIAIALLVALASTQAAAQRRDDITGKLVRVTAPHFADSAVVGTVTVYAQDGLTLTEQGTGAERRFPLRAVQRLDIYRGESAGATASRRVRTYGFIGLALGALAGPVVGIVTDRDLPTTTLLTAGGGAVGGMLLGAASGAARPTEQWSWVVSPWGYDASLRPQQP